MTLATKYVKKCRQFLDNIDDITLFNQSKVLRAFQNNKIAARHFVGSNGYGYDDVGRDALARVFADTFNTESAIVSPLICSGTHAITIALFGLVCSGDCILSITGAPYDTLADVIDGTAGSLSSYNIEFVQTQLLDNGDFDYDAIKQAIASHKPKVVYIQRSRGYAWRKSLTIEDIAKVVGFVRNLDCNCCIAVDNCYGEFVEEREPTDVGADVCIGSLIKNIGGGLAPTGGYIVGKKCYIDIIANRFTSPSIGAEVGSYVAGYRMLYQGLFVAPHTVGEAKKAVVLFSTALNELGYEVCPTDFDSLSDIVCSIKFGDRDKLIAFCQAIQSVSPVDSHVVPQPWAMPGYADQVIMSAGCFVQGASIELSCDAPIREPYIAYLQGSLTLQHAIIALDKVLQVLAK